MKDREVEDGQGGYGLVLGLSYANAFAHRSHPLPLKQRGVSTIADGNITGVSVHHSVHNNRVAFTSAAELRTRQW